MVNNRIEIHIQGGTNTINADATQDGKLEAGKTIDDISPTLDLIP